LKGHPVGPRSDQYSLAASIYELLSGAPPFRSEDVVSDIQLRPPSLLNRVGSAVNEAIQRALVKEPENRYTSCGALVEALQRAGGAAPVVPPGESMLENHRADQTVVLPRPDTAMLRMRLGAILRAEGLITEMQLQEALTIQQEKKEKLGAILVWLGFVDEESIAQALSQQLKVPFSLLDGEELDTSLLETWPLDLALSHVCLPLRYLGNLIVVAMADPLDLQTLNEVEARFGRQAQLLVTTATCLRERVEALSEKLA
jgi:serine/threonine protein kinase